MNEGPDFAEAAALIGDPACARMLGAMMDGRAWTATELAFEAGVGPSTASAHLAKLKVGGLVDDVRQGRHRYFRLAGSDVANAIEALMVLSTRASPGKRLPGPRDEGMRTARTCYGHLAGTSGVRLFAHLRNQGWIRSGVSGWSFTEVGGPAFHRWIGGDGVVLGQGGRGCLDWSERREHLGGPLGKAILQTLAERRLVRVGPGRLVEATPAGRGRLAEIFH